MTLYSVLYHVLFGKIQKLVPLRYSHFVVISRPGATIQGNVAKTGKFVNNYNNASFGSDYSHIHNSATLFTINTSDSPSV